MANAGWEAIDDHQRQEDVTDAVLAVMEQTSDSRWWEIMASLIRHLHGFVREVGLTEAEFQEATAGISDRGPPSGKPNYPASSRSLFYG